MLKVEIELLLEAGDRLRRQYANVAALGDRVSEIRFRLLRCGTVFEDHAAALARKAEELRREAEKLRAMYQAVEDIAAMYARCETELRDAGAGAGSGYGNRNVREQYQPQAAFIEPETFGLAYRELIAPLLRNIE